MKNFYKLLMVMLAFAFTSNVSAQLEGVYKMAPEAGAMGVGPAQGDISWWSNNVEDVTTRACFFDDEYVFGSDGSFSNVLQDETWVEAWQGGTDACGVPVAPHDGTVSATFSVDIAAGTVTINGLGAYLGIPKAVNGMELASPGDTPESVTYLADIQDGGETVILDIEAGAGVWWRFKMVLDGGGNTAGSAEGEWKMAQMAGAMGVGPGQGDISWWSNNEGDLTLRACFFDDIYVLAEDGSFANTLQAETWVEAWQGGTDACGTPVAPHDGTAVATWSQDDDAGTLTVDGVGAYMGIPKAVNGMELASPGDAPASVTYLLSWEDDGNIMVLDVEAGAGVWWRFKLEKAGPTGISSIESNTVSIYPNPAQDYINVSSEYKSARIFNINGSVVLEVVDNQSQINVSDLPAGVYFIQMNTLSGELQQARFVKQ